MLLKVTVLVANARVQARFKALGAVFLAQAHEPQAGAETLLRMGSRPEDGFHGGNRLRTGLVGPAHKPFRRPFRVVPVILRHVVRLRSVLALARQTQVAGHTFVACGNTRRRYR